MSGVDVEVKGLKETQKKLEQVARDLGGAGQVPGRQLQSAVARSMLYVEGKAKKKVPVDRGRLRASITPKVEQPNHTTIRGIVGSNVKYAPYQEFGTRPFWPPWEPIYRWALRVVQGDRKAAGALAYKARLSIAKRGIKAKKYFQEAFDESQARIKREIDRAVKAITSR